MRATRGLVVTWMIAGSSGCAHGPVVATSPAPAVANDAIEHSVFLIGDAGVEQEPVDPVLIALRAAVNEQPDRSTVVFLGDNIYPNGLPPLSSGDRSDAELRLKSQMDAVPPGARGIFVMGNHDWAGGAADGWAAVTRQVEFIAQSGRPDLAVLPRGGCPGPFVEDPSPQLRLVLLDTQWWLQDHDKASVPLPDCVRTTKAAVTDSIRSVMASRGNRVTIAAGHHVLESGGLHGGNFRWYHHVFPLRSLKSWLWLPLPIIGSIYPIARQSGITDQDMSGRANREMRDSLTAAFGDQLLLYAAGHEHNLQVLDGEVGYLVVSGAGGVDHESPVSRLANTRYARRAGGFVRADVLTDGRVRLAVLVTDRAGRTVEDFSMWLETRQ